MRLAAVYLRGFGKPLKQNEFCEGVVKMGLSPVAERRRAVAARRSQFVASSGQTTPSECPTRSCR
jgi:hypothetical protein